MKSNAFLKLMIISIILPYTINVSAQWAVSRPTVEDTVGINSLTAIKNNHSIVWATGSKYLVDSFYFGSVMNENIQFFKTEDAGTTWVSGQIPNSPNIFVNNICGTNAQKAWVNGINGDYLSVFFNTTDGGSTWHPTMTDMYVKPSSYVNAMVFLDSLVGVVIGDPAISTISSNPFFEIYRTSDGGNSWTRIDSSNIPTPLPDEYGSATYYSTLNDDIWFTTVLITATEYRDYRTFHSSDGGLHWTATETDASDISFVDPLNGLALDVYISIIRTTVDGGATWKDATIPPGIIMSCVMIPTSNYLMAVTSDNFLYGPFKTLLSKDRGETWIELGSGDEAGFLQFPTASLGYAGGLQRIDRPTELYKYNGAPLLGVLNGQQFDGKIELSNNPNNGLFSVKISQATNKNLTFLINDSNGNLIHKSDAYVRNEETKHFDISTALSGTYFLTVSSAEGSKTIKFIKLP